MKTVMKYDDIAAKPLVNPKTGRITKALVRAVAKELHVGEGVVNSYAVALTDANSPTAQNLRDVVEVFPKKQGGLRDLRGYILAYSDRGALADVEEILDGVLELKHDFGKNPKKLNRVAALFVKYLGRFPDEEEVNSILVREEKDIIVAVLKAAAATGYPPLQVYQSEQYWMYL